MGFDSIHVESTESLEGICSLWLYVALYFQKFQKSLWGVGFIGFFCSLLTETIQLVMHLGWFDLDDLLNNTMGCIVAMVFFRVFLKERKVEPAGEIAP